MKYRAVALGGSTRAAVSVLDDGSLFFRSTEALGSYPARLTDRLAQWAREAPDRVFVAKRAADGHWRKLTYADMLGRVRSIAESLLERPLSVERPIAILSDNDLEHLQMILGGMWAGIPTCSVSPGNSLLSKDFAKLKHVFSVLTPGLVFAAQAKGYAPAIGAAAPSDVEVVLAQGTLEGRTTTAFSSLLTPLPGVRGDAAQAAVTPDTIARFVFTSGSTKMPKAVTTTHRMLCSNQQMLLQCLRCLGDEPPVLVDWLPWNHTFGGSHNVGIVLYNGGTLYIDDGKPTPHLFAETLRNLREIAPTVFFNVPKAWEDLTAALETDAVLRQMFFSRVKLLFYAGAGLSQPVWDRLDRVAEETTGERIRMITGLGMTETSPSSLFTTGAEVRSGYVGLPAPGCDTKLTPLGEKFEARFRGPHVMPGYWRAPQQTREVFDADGFYCTGDALKPVDPAHPERGLYFDGRVTEDFKLSTGNFVSVGPLVQKVIVSGAPYVLDAVVAGMNRNDIGLLIFPRLDACRALAGIAADAPPAEVLDAAPVRKFFQALVDGLAAAGTGSSNRVARARILREPASFDRNEVTDKGSINQRAVLAQRSALVDAMYGEADKDVILPAPAARHGD